MSIGELLENQKLIICCGSGGVGKTTIAAALAVKACLAGKKVAVLTIDPAKRLANSLGLSKLENEEKEIKPQEFLKVGLRPKGRLFALMLDTKRTFDKIIARYAPSEESKNAILNNTLYQHLSGMIAGSQEYMAMEKVYELFQKKSYDLLILDTPPTQHALDFLDAPQKMIMAITDSMLKWFLKPSIFVGRTSLRFLERGARRILKAFDRVTGFEFLQDLSTMLLSTAGLLEGFKERAKEVEAVLKNPQTAFLLVTSPQALVVSEALYFYQKIREYKLPFAGFIVNRVHQDSHLTETFPSMIKNLPRLHLDETQKNKLLKILNAYENLVTQDQKQLGLLKEKLEDREELTLIPHLETDVHDLAGLAQVGNYL
jgi:anion-transporting  ArsA/GET3 family ATPase